MPGALTVFFDRWVLQNTMVCYLQYMEKINVAEKFNVITSHWQPGIAGELNGQQVKLVKFAGEFVWHRHEQEDEMFYVVKGSFDMHLRDRVITLHQGEFLIVPRGVEHKPVAAEEVQVMLFEPAGTLNTGDTENSFTHKNLQQL